jgi:D-glycero-D-manno-heptose 1,7-bisphosphate phosphatase
MIIPDQAVILCGGRGHRLRPITDKTPKPMVLVNGKPFLEYLLEKLRENSIREVVLMTGYLGEQIHEYFNDGSTFGLNIRYSHGPVEWDTGRRLYEVKPLVKDHFFLFYADNFVQFDLKKLTKFHQEKKTLLVFVVHPKSNGNVRLMADGTVNVYDKTRSAGNLEFVELGCMLADKRVFEYYDDNDVSFSDILFKLVLDRQVAGMVVRDTYYSVSDPERLKLTEQYLKPKKIVLIDRDGVINEKAPRGEYIAKWNSFRFIPETVNVLKEMSDKGFEFIVISNQAGIGRGTVTEEAVKGVNEQMIRALRREGIRILDIYVCPHHWEENCFCRKPNPGLFFQASRDWLFRLDKTYFVGDDARDCQAAYNAGCKSIFLGKRTELDHLSLEEHPLLVVENLEEAVPYLDEL